MSDNCLDTTVSSSLQLFQNAQFKVRVIMRDGEPWLVARDVAACIEHKDVSTMCKLCRDKDKVVVRANDLTSAELADVKNREYTLISESGLYRILAKCNLPKCDPFESWVFDEVLPAIRKTGRYSIKQPSYIIDDEIERAERWIAEEKERRALALELQGAKAELEDTAKELDETQEALEDEIAQHAKDNEDFCEGVKILNRQKAQISGEREARALARNADVVQREKIATWMTYVQKKQMGTLRLGKYKVESLLGTTWMRSCLDLDKIKDVKRWMTYTATRRVTIRVSNALDIAPKEVSKLRECYVQSKMYGIPFERVCYENDTLPNDYAYRIFADCVSVEDTYECKKGNGETKLSPVFAYSVEILGEVLCAMIDAKALNEWLRDDTNKDDFAWWVVEKASSNYDLPVDAA